MAEWAWRYKSRSLCMTHPFMPGIICAEYGKNPSRPVDITEWTRHAGHTDGRTDRRSETNITPTPPYPLTLLCGRYDDMKPTCHPSSLLFQPNLSHITGMLLVCHSNPSSINYFPLQLGTCYLHFNPTCHTVPWFKPSRSSNAIIPSQPVIRYHYSNPISDPILLFQPNVSSNASIQTQMVIHYLYSKPSGHPLLFQPNIQYSVLSIYHGWWGASNGTAI